MAKAYGYLGKKKETYKSEQVKDYKVYKDLATFRMQNTWLL